MAIIACPECGQKVSSTAEACPQCGHPVAKARRSKAVGMGCGGVLLIVAILAVIGSNSSPPSPKVAASPLDLSAETFQTKATTPACRQSDQLDKLIGFLVAKDNEAYRNYWMERALRGDCRTFDKGQKLFLEEASVFGNPCVRVRGETACMYAPRSYLDRISP